MTGALSSINLVRAYLITGCTLLPPLTASALPFSSSASLLPSPTLLSGLSSAPSTPMTLTSFFALSYSTLPFLALPAMLLRRALSLARLCSAFPSFGTHPTGR